MYLTILQETGLYPKSVAIKQKEWDFDRTSHLSFPACWSLVKAAREAVSLALEIMLSMPVNILFMEISEEPEFRKS